MIFSHSTFVSQIDQLIFFSLIQVYEFVTKPWSEEMEKKEGAQQFFVFLCLSLTAWHKFSQQFRKGSKVGGPDGSKFAHSKFKDPKVHLLNTFLVQAPLFLILSPGPHQSVCRVDKSVGFSHGAGRAVNVGWRDVPVLSYSQSYPIFKRLFYLNCVKIMSWGRSVFPDWGSCITFHGFSLFI